MTALGSYAVVHIPTSVLVNNASADPNLTFNAACVGDGNGGIIYSMNDVQNISCNLFPCQSLTVQICNTSLTIPGGTAMGGIIHVAMPPPYAMNKFTAQCVGNSGNAPAYQVTDERSVSCAAR
jgi:hypothetical protein